MAWQFNESTRRLVRIAAWFAVTGGAIYLYLFHRNLLHAQLQRTFDDSLFLAAAVYLLAGCLRGFTLIPSTYLVFAGLPFFSPRTLFVLTIIGILISSASIYFFSKSLHLDEYFGTEKHRTGKVKAVLERYGLPVIIGWSFFPFAPTDLICYVCGIMKINFWKFLLGVCIGEGAICAIYIFSGAHLLRFLHVGA